MNRIKFISQALEINEVQAELLNAELQEFPDDKLKDFFKFRMKFIQPQRSKEVTTKMALFEFKKFFYLARIKKGKTQFNSIDEVKVFCDTYFRNEDLCYGAGSFFDYVVIGMDKDGNLINKYFQNNGFFEKLTSHKESEVYEWLFKNQNRIGVIKNIPYYETSLKCLVGEKTYENIDGEILGLMRGEK